MTEKRTGFTGTRDGLTVHQTASLHSIMHGLKGWWHHGDCVGADKDSHLVARIYGLSICIHPPSNDSLRAWCTGDAMMEPKDYLARNKDIVRDTCMLVAAPATATEVQKSGTWSTVRFARKLGRPIILLLPDGTIRVERPPTS